MERVKRIVESTRLVANTDAEIWRKVWEAMSRPEVLEAKINGRIAQLKRSRWLPKRTSIALKAN